jgi:hypothetical protein
LPVNGFYFIKVIGFLYGAMLMRHWLAQGMHEPMVILIGILVTIISLLILLALKKKKHAVLQGKARAKQQRPLKKAEFIFYHKLVTFGKLVPALYGYKPCPY